MILVRRWRQRRTPLTVHERWVSLVGRILRRCAEAGRDHEAGRSQVREGRVWQQESTWFVQCLDQEHNAGDGCDVRT
jgi:hypothetical protein